MYASDLYGTIQRMIEQIHPTRIVRFNLLAVLIGVACTLAAEELSRSYSLPLLVSTIAFLATALNFFHGKVVALEDESYNRALMHRQSLALADFVLNVLVILLLVFLALRLGDPLQLVCLNIAVRAVDIVLVLTVKEISEDSVVRRAQISWLVIDAFALAVFLYELARILCTIATAVEASSIFLAVVVIDVVLDYSLNRSMYFTSASTWADVADLWDLSQQEDGDIYRRRIIVPKLQDCNYFEEKVVLDLGCGNGCMARWAIRLGAARVVAVDQFEPTLALARSYPNADGKIEYRSMDIDSVAQTPLDSSLLSAFDVVLACFSLQDCSSLDRPFSRMASAMKEAAIALVVTENDSAFSLGTGHAATSRRALGSSLREGKGREWLLFWDSVTLPYVSQCDRYATAEMATRALLSTGQARRSFATITRHWKRDEYEAAASRSGLKIISWEDLPVEGPATELPLREYSRLPKFSLAVFSKPHPELRNPEHLS